MAVLLPRGVQKLTRKNKDGTQVVSYRVQIKRKTLKIDKLFDDVKDAIDFLNTTKTKLGLKKIHLRLIEDEETLKQQREFLEDPPFSMYIKRYIEDYIEPKYRNVDKTTAEGKLKYRNFKNTLSFFKTIENTKVAFQSTSNADIIFPEFSSIFKKELGTLKVEEINESVINSYVLERAKRGLKAISIQREITFISNVFNKIKYLNSSKKHITNPTRNYDKDLLNNAQPTKKKSFRFAEGQKEEFLKCIEQHSNPDFIAIVKLMLLTAMRRSETVLLKWSQIFENQIELLDTKTGSRFVYLTKEAQELIKSIPKKPNQDRLFNYTVLGFEGSYTKFLKDRGMQDITSHKLRKEAISNFVEKIGAENSLLIAEILGISSIRKLEENIKQMPSPALSTQNSVLKSIGHKNSNITKKHYFSLKKKQ